MHFYHIAINNMRRRKTNMIFLVAGMVIGIATLVTLFLLTQAMEKSLSKDFDAVGSRVLVFPGADQASFTFEGVTLAQGVTYDIELFSYEVLEKIKESSVRDKLLAVAPKYIRHVDANGLNMTIMAVDFDEEILLRPYWEIAGVVPKEENQILLGSWAAESLHLSPGQKINIDQEIFTVSGVLNELGEQDDDKGFIALSQANNHEAAQESISFIELSVETKGDNNILDQVVSQLSIEIPEARVTSVKEAIDVRREMVERFKNFFILISGLMLLIASLSVATSMQSSINARTKELGIFRAIGFRKKHIIKIIALEANILSIGGGFLGYLIGTGAAYLSTKFITDFKLAISFNPILALSVILLAAFLGTVSSAYSAVKGASMDPSDALRQI
jgi:putative ABC transport system permease protein